MPLESSGALREVGGHGARDQVVLEGRRGSARRAERQCSKGGEAVLEGIDALRYSRFAVSSLPGR